MSFFFFTFLLNTCKSGSIASFIIIEVALQVFIKSVVSDHEHCTALAERVLRDRGSSVDAAITAALCLGVVHPHVSGVGG